jgi:predicted Rossmann-fold nucleotide-binding protein
VAISSSPAESSQEPREPGSPATGPGAAPSALTVGVVGSARLEPPDPRCALAEQTGAAIAAQGKVIGLPMRGWANLTPNQWNNELRWSTTYAERLAHLLAADAVVVLDGGIGTLSEAATVWAALQTEPDAADLVFLGTGWEPVLRAFTTHLVIDDRDLAHITICTDPRQAVAHIAQARSRRQRSARPRG